MNSHLRLFFSIVLLLTFASALFAAPAAVPDTPAVAVVRQFVAARLAGQVDPAYVLLYTTTQPQLPKGQIDQYAAYLQSGAFSHDTQSFPPSIKPLIALFMDYHNVLHFKFRVLGASPTDPSVVQVRAFQVGSPPDSVKVLNICTVADTAANGAIRLDSEKTVMLLDPSFSKQRTIAQRAISRSNLTQLALGIIQYTQDHDEKLPDADKWVDEIMPYVKTEAIFRDPSAPAGEKWSYAYNRNLSGVSLAKLDSPASTVMLFESKMGVKNANDTGESIPMPGRHQGGTDYAQSDGHVEWLADGTKLSFLLSGK